ncbi:uncharacterized protein METZ01_LOCUS73605 [marine metagenome]|uniref:Uncharacterized protein n=1 Tax=marine metagenome TaxID=408172 RepID=A0A381TZ61_9ZZZZ
MEFITKIPKTAIWRMKSKFVFSPVVLLCLKKVL